MCFLFSLLALACEVEVPEISKKRIERFMTIFILQDLFDLCVCRDLLCTGDHLRSPSYEIMYAACPKGCLAQITS